METQTIALEDTTSIGSMPVENFTGSTRVPIFNRPSEIYVSRIGRVKGEDALDGGDIQIQFETDTVDLSGVNIGGNNILLEEGTEQAFLESIYFAGLFQGFDAHAERFDTTQHTFDMTTQQ